MPKLQLSFHTTFALKKEDLLKILNAASQEKGLDDSLENLMKRTGLGNQKVRPMISWVTRGGLIKDKDLSPEGKIILKLDPHLESLTTDWFMHFYLSFGSNGLKTPPDDPTEWGGWTYFVYSFLPEHKAFTLNELQHNSILIFQEEKPQSLVKNFRIVLRAYTESQALAACKFLTVEDNQYQAGNSRLPNSYLVGYFLAKLWERDFSKETSVLTEDIMQQKMGLVSVLGIETESLQEHLNALESLGIIEQRRTVSPYQIIRRWDNPLTLLEKAYTND